MNLSQQVISLELAKRLKELGVKQESHFNWNVETEEGKESGVIEIYTEAEWEAFAEDNLPSDSEMYSAFTVAELGELLKPMGRSIESAMPFWNGKKWYSEYFGDEPAIEATTEAGARAAMLIYLIKNKLMTV